MEWTKNVTEGRLVDALHVLAHEVTDLLFIRKYRQLWNIVPCRLLHSQLLVTWKYVLMDKRTTESVHLKWNEVLYLRRNDQAGWSYCLVHRIGSNLLQSLPLCYCMGCQHSKNIMHIKMKLRFLHKILMHILVKMPTRSNLQYIMVFNETKHEVCEYKYAVFIIFGEFAPHYCTEIL